MARERVTAADLEHAASWLEEYNNGDTDDERGHDEVAVTMFRVAAWLRAEAERRNHEARIRSIMAEHGVTRAQAVTAWERALASVRTQQAEHLTTGPTPAKVDS